MYNKYKHLKKRFNTIDFISYAIQTKPESIKLHCSSWILYTYYSKPKYYRPQTKFAKVMFSHVSVCSPEGSPSRGVSVWGVSVWGSLSRGSLSRRASVQGGLCLGVSVQGRSLSKGVSVWGSLSREVSVTETPRTVMSGRYASYSNAFLFLM